MVNFWERRRGVEHDPRFWFGPWGYWWLRNMTGRAGTEMVMDFIRSHVEY